MIKPVILNLFGVLAFTSHLIYYLHRSSIVSTAMFGDILNNRGYHSYPIQTLY